MMSISEICNVLAVDDQPEFLDPFAKIISGDTNAQVLKATSGKEAIQLYKKKKNKIAVAIIDQNMELGGYETAKKLREINRDIFIIFVTVVGRQEMVEEFHSFSIQGYYEKPLTESDVNDLTREIKKLRFKFFLSNLLKKSNNLKEVRLELTKIVFSGNLVEKSLEFLRHHFNFDEENIYTAEQLLPTLFAPSETIFNSLGHIDEFIDDEAVVRIPDPTNDEIIAHRIFPKKVFQNADLKEGMNFLLKSELMGNRIISTFDRIEESSPLAKHIKKLDSIELDDGDFEDDY